MKKFTESQSQFKCTINWICTSRIECLCIPGIVNRFTFEICIYYAQRTLLYFVKNQSDFIVCMMMTSQVLHLSYMIVYDFHEAWKW